MKVHWNPQELAALAYNASVLSEEKRKSFAEDLYAGYRNRLIRCGFLWLKTRKPTQAEFVNMLKRSQYWESYDHAWDDVHYYANKAEKMLEIYEMCLQVGVTSITLSESEAQFIVEMNRLKA